MDSNALLKLADMLDSGCCMTASEVATQLRTAAAEGGVKWFPLLGTPFAIRWNVLNESQAEKNHYQPLTRLAERGGLSPSEAIAVVEQRAYRNVAAKDAYAALLAACPPTDSGAGRDGEQVMAEAYQVVGSLLSDVGAFDTQEAVKILDNLSQQKLVHSDVIPWPSFGPQHIMKLEQDAGRYRWLRKNLLWAYSGRGIVRWSLEIPMPMPDIQVALNDDSVALDLDAAIDNAIAGAAGERDSAD